MATSIIGKLADKANIVKSSFSDFEKAIIKATRHNHKPPKEKHVRRLTVYTSDSTARCSEIILLLGKRLEIPDWIVVMKTLCVFHRLMRDGNPKFLSELKYKMGVFNLRKFSDMSSPEANHQSVFIRKYSQYLEEKMLVFKILGLEFEKDPSITKSFTVQEGFDKIPRLQSQINALLNCRGSRDHLNNSIIIGCFTLLLKDSFPLYRALNDAIIVLLENYFSMPRDNATKALDIYKLFSKETDGMIQFFDIAKKFSRTDLPELQHAPASLVEALENYIAELDSGRTPNSNSDGKATVSQTRTLIKQSQNKMENFRFDDQDAADSDSDDEIQSNASFPDQFPNNGNATSSTQQIFETQRSPAQQINLIDDLFDSPNTFGQPVVTTANKPPTAFDPFESIPTDNQANNTSYLDKKKNVEILMNQPTFAVSSTPLQPQTARPVAAPVVYGTQPAMTTPSFVPMTSPTAQQVNPFQQTYTGNPYGSQYGVQPALNPFAVSAAPQTNPFLQPQANNNQNPFL